MHNSGQRQACEFIQVKIDSHGPEMPITLPKHQNITQIDKYLKYFRIFLIFYVVHIAAVQRSDLFYFHPSFSLLVSFISAIMCLSTDNVK